LSPRQDRSIPFKRIGRKIFYARDDVLAHFGAAHDVGIHGAFGRAAAPGLTRANLGDIAM
jgi:hypothetical protein